MSDLRQPPVDCSGCGACCHTSRERPLGFIELKSREEVDRLPEDFRNKFVTYNERRGSWMISTTKSRFLDFMISCPAAAGTPGEDGHCSIYENRPDVCRRWPVGNSTCLKIRSRLADYLDRGKTVQGREEMW